MTPEEKAEVAPSADNFSKVFGDRTEEPMSVTAADTAVSLATPVDSVVEVQKELQKEEPDYLKIGMLAGVEALGSIPALGPVAKSMVRKGADLAKQTDTAIEGTTNIPAVSVRANTEFKNTVKGYKLFTRGEDGKLYPLFVDADTEVPVGSYMKAVFPEYRFKAENGNYYVPSRGTKGKKGTGDSIKIPDQETRDMLIKAGFLAKGSKAKTIKAVAARPGWHAGDNPTAAHIGPEVKIDGKSYKIRGGDQVWAEVEMPADVDWQGIANSRALLKKDGTPNVKTAHITDELPFGGYYRYKTNPNMQGNWLISGEMKVNRILDRDEVKKLNAEAGVEDLPTEAELREKLGKGFASGGLVGADMYQGVDDYQMAEMGAGMKEDQTRMAFALGGSVEEVDPVSGNEVPLGSLPEEVRDDIDANLSEGEYVVPADVVRYYGVKFFEDLRSQAKMGFEDMAANGRIGGEPVPAEGGLPFDVSELQAEEVADEPMMMNEGGDVTSMIQPDFMQGYTLPSAGQTQEYKTFVNDQGLTMTIRFVNGQPTVAVPAGYTEVGKEQPTATTPTSDRDRKSDRPIEVSKRDIPDYSSIPEGKKEADSWFSSVQKEIMGAKSLAGASVPVIGLAQIAHRKDIGKKLNALLKREDITEVNKTKVQSLLDQLNGENEPDFLGGLTNMADSIKSGVSTAADNFRNRAGMFYDPLEDISDTSLRDYGKKDKQGNRVLQTIEERQKDKDQSLSNAMVSGGSDAFHKQASENYRKDMEAAGYKSTPTGFVKRDNSDQRDAQDNNPNSGSRSYSGKSDGKGGYTF